MNSDNEDDLQRLWQSQPVDRSSVRAPRFSLLDEMTVPNFMPLSWGRRASYLVGFLWAARQYWQSGRNGGWLEYVSGIGILLCITGSVMVFRERNRSRAPQPEESVQAFRQALFDEFEHQFNGERRILLLLLGGWVLASILQTMASIAKAGTVHASELGLTAVLILLLAAGLRMYYRAANVVRTRLIQGGS